MVTANLQIQRGVDELGPLRLDVTRRQHLQQLLGGIDQTSAIPPHIDDQAGVGQVLGQPYELVHELIRIPDVEGENSNITVFRTASGDLFSLEDSGHEGSHPPPARCKSLSSCF